MPELSKEASGNIYLSMSETTNTINYQMAINYATLLNLVGYRGSEFAKQGSNIRLWYETNRQVTCAEQEIAKMMGIPVQQIQNAYQWVKTEFEKIGFDYTILSGDDAGYPELLKNTKGAPPFLFVRGNMELFKNRVISVVGSRKPTQEGKKRAFKLAALLANSGFVVVSGLARGIDTAAHRGAIVTGGNTIGVIGTPLDHSYPKENAPLQEKIADSHLLVSQFPFGHPIRRYNFPARNSVMSGLSLATIIVEAGETSGALIQARQSLKQGKTLFLLQSLLENKELKWPEQMVAKGAIPVSNIEDIVEHLKTLTTTPGKQSPLL